MKESPGPLLHSTLWGCKGKLRVSSHTQILRFALLRIDVPPPLPPLSLSLSVSLCLSFARPPPRPETIAARIAPNIRPATSFKYCVQNHFRVAPPAEIKQLALGTARRGWGWGGGGMTDLRCT